MKKCNKLLIFMKLSTCATLLFMVTSIFASKANSQNVSVDISGGRITIENLMEQIESQTDYLFVYSKNEVNTSRKTIVAQGEQTVGNCLDEALSGVNMSYDFKDDYIVLREAGDINLQQSNRLKVTGVVTDSKGETLPGASIMAKGESNNVTMTDLDGKYTITINPGTELEFSYIGYDSQVVNPNGRATLNIVLKEDSQMLSEVVVVGYGTQKRESLTGALSMISADELQDITSSDVTNMLQAKATGVWVGAGGGQPGAEGTVLIRGKSTINGSTAPLWVIDGVITDESAGLLNPNDIESMTVLKDAASTAIYGSKGANGVILVTTRRAKSGEARFNISAKFAATQLSKGNLDMTNGSELYDYYLGYENQEAITFSRYNDDLRNQNYDWFGNGEQIGLVQDYNFSLTGGTEKMKTFTSIGIYDEVGAVKGYDYSRYTVRHSSEYEATDWFTFKPKFSAARRDIRDEQHNLGAMYTNLPWDSPYDDNGDLIQKTKPTDWVATDKSNYQYDLQWNFSESTFHEVSANMDFDVKFTDWLTFSSINNYRFVDRVTKTYVDPRASGGLSVGGTIDDDNSNTQRVYTNQLLRFNKYVGDHSINALFAYEWQTLRYESFEQATQGFAAGFIVPDVGASPRDVGGNIQEWAVQSLLTNVNYAYDSRYLGQFSFRRDGASNFGTNAKYGNFFSVSGGWNIHQESFFNVDAIQQLKLRASYGSVGNRPDDNYPQYALYAVNRKYDGSPGAILDQIENKDLTWEKTYTTGIGLDMRIFDKVELNLDIYSKVTKDLLYEVPIPGVVGLSTMWQNVGQVNNKGIELSINYDIIQTKDWHWSVGGNISFNKNEITELYGEGEEIVISNGGASILGVLDKVMKVGYDIDTWYGAEWAGVNSQTGAPEWYYTTEDGAREKTSVYSDAQKSKVMLGSITPDFYGGFMTSLNWKGLSLLANFTYSVGGEAFNYDRTVYDSDGAYPTYNQVKFRDDWSRWTQPGDIATHPKATYKNTSNSSKPSSRQLEDMSFLRLKSLVVGYTLPVKIPLVESVRLSLSGENLFLITDFSGIDPELPFNTTNGRVGVYASAYPQTRKFLFSINITL